jgi:hypothetical protein
MRHIQGGKIMYHYDIHDPYIPEEQYWVGKKLFMKLVPGKNGGVICHLPKKVVDHRSPPVRDYDVNCNFIGWVRPTKTVKGPVCLISKDSNACCGWAHITITAVKNTYCIAKAEMLQFELPSDEVIMATLMDKWEHKDYSAHEGFWFGKSNSRAYPNQLSDYEISFHRNGKCGSYLVVSEREQFGYKTALTAEWVDFDNQPIDCMGHDGATVETYNLADWVRQQKSELVSEESDYSD